MSGDYLLVAAGDVDKFNFSGIVLIGVGHGDPGCGGCRDCLYRHTLKDCYS